MAILTAPDIAAAGIKKINGGFDYGGRKVRVEIIRPSGSEPVPAALVLHGASGIGRGWYVYPFAEALAKRGVAAAVVHYYDGISPKYRKQSPRIFEARDRILRSAITYVLGRKDVVSNGLGIYGMSLGGFHALSLGVADKRVKAIVSLGGALSGHIPENRVGRLPPTLLLHGSRDRVVPFKRAVKASKAIEKYGAKGELKIYRGEGHSLSRAAHADAVASTARFLAKGLRKTLALADNSRR